MAGGLWTLFGGLAVLALVLSVVFIAWHRRSKGRANKAWSEVAAQFDGAFHRLNLERTVSAPRVVVEANPHGQRVRIEQVPAALGSLSFHHTRIVVPCSCPSSLSLQIDRAPRSGGAPGVCTGDAAFDKRFTVTASQAQWAQALLTEVTRQEITEATKYEFKIAGGEAVGTYSDLDVNSTRMTRAVRATLRLAHTGEQAAARGPLAGQPAVVDPCRSCAAKAELFDGLDASTRGLRKVLGIRADGAFLGLVGCGLFAGLLGGADLGLYWLRIAHGLIAGGFAFLVAGFRGGTGGARRVRQLICAAAALCLLGLAVFPGPTTTFWEIVALIAEAFSD